MKQQPPGKMRIARSLSLFLIAGLTLALCFTACEKETKHAKTTTKAKYVPPEFKSQGALTFHRSGKKKDLKMDMEIADNPEERQTGMMRRDEMTDQQCMLFIFNDEQERSFWMSNTKLPLDIIFVSADKKIVSIQKNALPYDESHYWSEKPAQYVVEVIGGFSDKYAIAPGDSISFIRYDKF